MIVTPDAMTRIVHACRTAKQLADAFDAAGSSPTWTALHDIYGDLIDAVYSMRGEHTMTLDESLAYQVLSDLTIPDTQAATTLT